MDSGDFIGLSPSKDSENDPTGNLVSESRGTEIQQSSLSDKINSSPTNAYAEVCNSTDGIEQARSSEEPKINKDIDVQAVQIIQDSVETAVVDLITEVDVINNSILKNGCAIVDCPNNGLSKDSNGAVGVEHGQHCQEMELVIATSIAGQKIRQDCTEMATNKYTAMEKMDVIQKSIVNEDGNAFALDVSMLGCSSMGESSISGVKRSRTTCGDQGPSVHVVYNSLTRDSMKKIKELLQHWSEWHAQHHISVTDCETLEHGEETYFPALHVGQERSSLVPFWVDNQSRKAEIEEIVPDNDTVPIYDREYALGSNLVDGSPNAEMLESLEASRCFNCSSYSHSLKECPKPRDNVAISSARKQHSARKNANTGARGQSRYYISSPGKFDDLKPGILGPETRECLGIGEHDPPPWLHRMREIGYPPGYLDVKEDEDQPSGIAIFADEEIASGEEGELPGGSEPAPPEKKMTVEFPGINAPIPEKADRRQWAGPTPNSQSTDTWRKHHQNSSPSPDVHRSFSQDHRRPREYGERAVAASNNVSGSSSHGYSSRYSPYDRSPVPRSPTLTRSQSDRWRSPLGYESSPGYGPQTPHHPSRESPHHYTPSSSDRWDPRGSYNGHPNSSSSGRDREWYDHHYHHRR